MDLAAVSRYGATAEEYARGWGRVLAADCIQAEVRPCVGVVPVDDLTTSPPSVTPHLFVLTVGRVVIVFQAMARVRWGPLRVAWVAAAVAGGLR